MRYASFTREGKPCWGIVDGDQIFEAPDDPEVPRTLVQFIESGDPAPDISTWQSVPLTDVRLAAPIPEPIRNVMCLGLNYADHAAESQGLAPGNAEVPEYPIVFTKATTTITGPESEVVLDERVTQRLDWEVELAVVIGRGGRFIEADSALNHVFGYTILNDLSARELQRRHMQFFLGKSMDGSCPMGPWIVSRDEIPNPHDLNLSCLVNGIVKQDSNTRFLIFRIPQLIEQLSTVMTLLPGDIIATGTPAGVGFAREPAEYLNVDDTVECRIDRIGSIRNRIIGPSAASA